MLSCSSLSSPAPSQLAVPALYPGLTPTGDSRRLLTPLTTEVGSVCCTVHVLMKILAVFYYASGVSKLSWSHRSCRVRYLLKNSWGIICSINVPQQHNVLASDNVQSQRILGIQVPHHNAFNSSLQNQICELVE